MLYGINKVSKNSPKNLCNYISNAGTLDTSEKSSNHRKYISARIKTGEFRYKNEGE